MAFCFQKQERQKCAPVTLMCCFAVVVVVMGLNFLLPFLLWWQQRSYCSGHLAFLDVGENSIHSVLWDSCKHRKDWSASTLALDSLP